jgi:hypothetical protein
MACADALPGWATALSASSALALSLSEQSLLRPPIFVAPMPPPKFISSSDSSRANYVASPPLTPSMRMSALQTSLYSLLDDSDNSVSHSPARGLSYSSPSSNTYPAFP